MQKRKKKEKDLTQRSQRRRGHREEKEREIPRFARNDGIMDAPAWRGLADDGIVYVLAGRGIGDFTEDGGAASAGRGRKIRRAPMEGFVSEQSEGECLLGVFGDAKAGGGEHFN